MNIPKKNRVRNSRWLSAIAGLLVAVAGGAGADVDVSQSPLYVGSNVPGNLALVPSVEYPTAISVANLGNFVVGTKYVGYFDSSKCYKYQYSDDETQRYFYPVPAATAAPDSNYQCSAVGYWSGNFLNWAATQTIDPFRSALTGGYRVIDTPTTTVVEKAIADRVQTGNFPRRTVSGGGTVQGGVASKWSKIQIRIDGLGNKMWITQDLDLGSVSTPFYVYDPSKHKLDGSCLETNNKGNCTLKDNAAIFELSVRVKVCDSAAGLEANCVRYSQGYKPEGLIQEYSQRIKYSIFGYLNIDGNGVDTGVMRARQKFVGPKSYAPEQGPLDNPNKEWDATTGVLYTNPDKTDADATTVLVGASKPIVNSGVINYLNKFGQMNTGKNIKSNDDVSELYYAALRYFKNQGDVPAYSAFTGTDANTRYQQADAFPVINNWKTKNLDPVAYWCQTNVILGIGDTNTHNDKNLPGNQGYGGTSRDNEPAMPAEVKADTTVDVVKLLTNILKMEGDTNAVSRATSASFNGNGNSGYIAALAYHAHTTDIRPDLKGTQTLSTHWVDVVENGDYKSKLKNQYWLAGKYGGFSVPAGYDPTTNVTPLASALWWNNGQYVNNNTSFERADNFYVANEATKMVESLKKAFERIIDEMKGSASSLASNTTKLEAGAMTFQSVFYAGTWRGDMVGYQVNTSNGALSQVWSASAQMPNWSDRKIKFASGTTLANFATGNLGSTPLSTATQAQIDYLRGDRSNEGSTSGKLRVRTGILGDIVNSQPVYVGAPNAGLYVGASFAGATGYAAFATARAGRTPMLYVGGNDGMLHAFNAQTGAEAFAFVPKGAMTNLLAYTRQDYEHRYYVDGELTVSDVYDTSTSSWRSVLVGTMGRGGKGAFALDVTDPANISLLWDKSDGIAGMGNNLGKPIIGQLADGAWYAMVGNGPNSSSDGAELLVINALTGDSVRVDTGATGANGLSAVLAWSSGNNYIADRIYAGDLQGNMWRFDMTGTSATVTRLFSAVHGSTAQPITAAPAAARDPATGLTWIFFGTGKYLSDGDLSNKDVQTWYGLIDRGTTIPSDHSTLGAVDITDQGEVSGTTARVIESVSSPGADGWYIDLLPPSDVPQGERMIVSNFFQGTALIGTSRIPDAGDVCSPSGKGFVMAISPFNGGRLSQSFFDFDGSGGSNAGDNLNGKPASGIGLDSSPNNPIFVGSIMQVGLDDASTKSIGTNGGALSMRRVSWRELMRND